MKHARKLRASCGCSTKLRMPRTGDLSAMFAEGELLEKICDVLARRHEPHFDSPVGTNRGDASYKAEWIRNAITQIHFENTLAAKIRKGWRRLPHAAER